MRQKRYSAKTGQEIVAAPRGALKDQPKFDGAPKPEPKKAAPEKKPQRRERADSIVQRILAEIKKIAGPNPASPESKAADAEKKLIKQGGKDIANPNRKSAEERADSYDAPSLGKPKDQTLAAAQVAGRGAPPIQPPGPGPMPKQRRPPMPPVAPPSAPPQPEPKAQPAGGAGTQPKPPMMPPSPGPATPVKPQPPLPPMPPSPSPFPGAGEWVDAGYGEGPLNAQGLQWRPLPGNEPPMPTNNMDAVYDGMMGALLRRTQRR